MKKIECNNRRQIECNPFFSRLILNTEGVFFSVKQKGAILVLKALFQYI